MDQIKARIPLAIDADGVILDFERKFMDLWEQKHGDRPERVCNAYSSTTSFGLQDKCPDLMKFIYENADIEDFYGNMNMLPGAEEAIHELHDMGFELICVTAIPNELRELRFNNLINKFKLPISDILTAPRTNAIIANPKALIVNAMEPIALIEDHVHNFLDINPGIARIYINPSVVDVSPDESTQPHFAYDSLYECMQDAIVWKHARI